MKLFKPLSTIKRHINVIKLYAISNVFTTKDEYNMESRFAKFASSSLVDILNEEGYKITVGRTHGADEYTLFWAEYPIYMNYHELGKLGSERLYCLVDGIVMRAYHDMGLPKDNRTLHLYRVNIRVAEKLNFKLRVEIGLRY